MAPRSDNIVMAQDMQAQTWAMEESGSSSSMMMEDVSLHSCQTAKTNNRVRFCEDKKVATVPSLCDLSLDEINATWFNEEDYKDVHMENEFTECAMTCEVNRHMVDDELLCARGLSDSESLLARAECNDFIQKLVLNQFAFLSSQGSADFGAVAKVYHDCSAPAVNKAHELALRDAEDAMEYLTSDQ